MRGEGGPMRYSQKEWNINRKVEEAKDFMSDYNYL